MKGTHSNVGVVMGNRMGIVIGIMMENLIGHGMINRIKNETMIETRWILGLYYLGK